MNVPVPCNITSKYNNMNDLKNRMSLRIAKLALTNKLALYPLYEGFKIGKTTQTIEDRFAEDYSDDYDYIEKLYDAGTDGELVDWLEEEMIKYCKATFAGECDNEQIGGGPKCADNADKDHTAKLYVVIR